MDRNMLFLLFRAAVGSSLSARRAWIEMLAPRLADMSAAWSLSARRAWIEIIDDLEPSITRKCRSPQGERG